MLVIVIMIPRIIQVIAILSLCDLMIPAIPMPKMSTPTIIGNFMPKFNNNNKLLSQNIYQSVYSSMFLLSNLDFSRFSRLFGRKLMVRKHRRKDRSVNAVFSVVIVCQVRSIREDSTRLCESYSLAFLIRIT